MKTEEHIRRVLTIWSEYPKPTDYVEGVVAALSWVLKED